MSREGLASYDCLMLDSVQLPTMASAISSTDSKKGVEKVSATNPASNFVQQFGKIWPQCIARAWQDTEFREALKRDPVGTIQGSYQFVFPQGFKIEIAEANEAQQAASADTLRMVIPPPPDGEVGEIALSSVGNGNGPKPPRPFTLSFTC